MMMVLGCRGDDGSATMIIVSYYDDVSESALGVMVEAELRLKECLSPFRFL